MVSIMVSQKQKWSICMTSLLYGMSVIRDMIFIKNDYRFGMEVFPFLCWLKILHCLNVLKY